MRPWRETGTWQLLVGIEVPESRFLQGEEDEGGFFHFCLKEQDSCVFSLRKYLTL